MRIAQTIAAGTLSICAFTAAFALDASTAQASHTGPVDSVSLVGNVDLKGADPISPMGDPWAG